MKPTLLPALALSLAAALAVIPAAITPAQAAQASAPAEKARVVGVLFYADWCASCKVLDPKIQAVKRDFAEDSVLFTRFDLTDEFTRRQSLLLAEQLGLGEIARKHGNTTGFMLLVSNADGRVLGRLVRTNSEADIRQSIQGALASAGKAS